MEEIKPNELRIGNLLFYPKDKEFEVCEILNHPSCERDYSYMARGKHFGCYFSDLSPVPLTTEWLEKVGFHWCEMRNGFTKSVSEACEMVIDGRGNIEVGDDFKRDSPILNVHTLQNFYYSLTGEELTIKPDVVASEEEKISYISKEMGLKEVYPNSNIWVDKDGLGWVYTKKGFTRTNISC